MTSSIFFMATIKIKLTILLIISYSFRLLIICLTKTIIQSIGSLSLHYSLFSVSSIKNLHKTYYQNTVVCSALNVDDDTMETNKKTH